MKQKTIFSMIGVLIVFSIICYVLTHEFLLNWLLSTPYVFTPLLWLAYCLCEGVLHAYYYGHKPSTENYNEHPLFMGMRACVLIPLGAWLNDGMAVFAMACMQPFTHNGMYYYWRKKVDGVYGHWFDQSKTSRAILTTIMTPLHRTILMAVGLAVFILTALDLINTDF